MVILLSTKYRKYFKYLDALRTSGVTNMLGASPYINRKFGVGEKESHQILTDWMKCYSARSGDSREYVDLEKLGKISGLEAMLDRLGAEVKPQRKTGQEA